jgi:hypothetical protein
MYNARALNTNGSSKGLGWSEALVRSSATQVRSLQFGTPNPLKTEFRCYTHVFLLPFFKISKFRAEM